MKINLGKRKWVELLKSAWENDIEFMQGMGRRLSDDDIARIWHDIDTKETISMEFAKKIGESEAKRCKDEWKKIKVAFHDKIHIMGNDIRDKFLSITSVVSEPFFFLWSFPCPYTFLSLNSP